jgi:hypothetical protein
MQFVFGHFSSCRTTTVPSSDGSSTLVITDSNFQVLPCGKTGDRCSHYRTTPLTRFFCFIFKFCCKKSWESFGATWGLGWTEDGFVICSAGVKNGANCFLCWNFNQLHFVCVAALVRTDSAVCRRLLSYGERQTNACLEAWTKIVPTYIIRGT